MVGFKLEPSEEIHIFTRPMLRSSKLISSRYSGSWKARLISGRLGVIFLGLASAQAQFDPNQIQQLNNNLANDAVSAVEVFSAGNTIAGGAFKYDNPGESDVAFDTYKLPASYQFGSPTDRFRPFVGAYAGYFDLKQDVAGFGPPTGQLRVQSWTATAGGGVEWRVNDWLSISPRLMVAYSHAWQNYNRDVPPDDPTAGLLVDWEANALTLLPAIEAKAAWTLGRWELGINSRYTYLRVLGLSDNSPLIDLDSESQVWRNEVTARYRSPWNFFSLPVSPYAAFARHDLGGQIRRSDFVEHFYEARLGTTFLLPDLIRPIRELDFSGAYYFQGPLTGYSIGLALDF